MPFAGLMKVPSISVLCVGIVILPFTSFLHAEDKTDPQQAFQKEGQRYEKLADKYAGMAEKAPEDKAVIYTQLSKNYGKMAKVKNDAAKATRRGNLDTFNWNEYEALEKQNQELLTKVKGKHGGKYDNKSKKNSSWKKKNAS